MKTYLHAVSPYETRDVIQGISDFITGSVTGHNPAFAPSAPLVGSVVRRAMLARLERDRLSKLALPAPVAPRHEPTDEEKARVRAKLDEFNAQRAQEEAPMADDLAKRKAEFAARSAAYFAPDMSPEAVAARLHVGVRYSVGDPDAESGDMGQARASA